ncbi:MAG: low molecular weight phosphatase family protein [Thermodesulfobacteriota bacterium]
MAQEKAKKRLLFVCVGNTCRSQMAEGFARHYGAGRVEVRSAGTSAAGYVSKSTVRAMEEIGIDISAQSSKQLTDEMLDWADVVVTLGCCSADDICPVTFSCEKIDWEIGDPLGRPWEVMQRVRDDIGKKVRELIGD